MSRRLSQSYLDPWIAPAVPRLYRWLHLPPALPPEAIVALGHLMAVAGAVGFAFSQSTIWGGLLAAGGVLGNHLCDMVDGTHARQTGQCRNGGELLDHFTDPLSFSYWMVGLGMACGRLELALVGVIFVYATAVLTNIRAKITGEFRLSRVGPTEFKALLAGYGVVITGFSVCSPGSSATVALGFLSAICGVGVIQLIAGLVLAVREVNSSDVPPDTSEWSWRTDGDVQAGLSSIETDRRAPTNPGDHS